MLNVNIFLLHDDIDKSRVNILMLHVDIIYLTCRGRSMPPWQKYATMAEVCHYTKQYEYKDKYKIKIIHLVPGTDKWNHDGSFVDPSQR